MKILVRVATVILGALFIFVVTFDPLANFIFVQPVYRAYYAARIQYQQWTQTRLASEPQSRFVFEEVEKEY